MIIDYTNLYVMVHICMYNMTIYDILNKFIYRFIIKFN